MLLHASFFMLSYFSLEKKTCSYIFHFSCFHIFHQEKRHALAFSCSHCFIFHQKKICSHIYHAVTFFIRKKHAVTFFISSCSHIFYWKKHALTFFVLSHFSLGKKHALKFFIFRQKKKHALTFFSGVLSFLLVVSSVSAFLPIPYFIKQKNDEELYLKTTSQPRGVQRYFGFILITKFLSPDLDTYSNLGRRRLTMHRFQENAADHQATTAVQLLV